MYKCNFSIELILLTICSLHWPLIEILSPYPLHCTSMLLFANTVCISCSIESIQYVHKHTHTSAWSWKHTNMCTLFCNMSQTTFALMVCLRTKFRRSSVVLMDNLTQTHTHTHTHKHTHTHTHTQGDIKTCLPLPQPIISKVIFKGQHLCICWAHCGNLHLVHHGRLLFYNNYRVRTHSGTHQGARKRSESIQNARKRFKSTCTI